MTKKIDANAPVQKGAMSDYFALPAESVVQASTGPEPESDMQVHEEFVAISSLY